MVPTMKIIQMSWQIMRDSQNILASVADTLTLFWLWKKEEIHESHCTLEQLHGRGYAVNLHYNRYSISISEIIKEFFYIILCNLEALFLNLFWPLGVMVLFINLNWLLLYTRMLPYLLDKLYPCLVVLEMICKDFCGYSCVKLELL